MILFTATYMAATLKPIPMHMTPSGSITCITPRIHTQASLHLLAILSLLLLLLPVWPYPAAAAAANAARLEAEL
jgi:hypothetical protein